jgi:hypothetical protein
MGNEPVVNIAAMEANYLHGGHGRFEKVENEDSR